MLFSELLFNGIIFVIDEHTAVLKRCVLNSKSVGLVLLLFHVHCAMFSHPLNRCR